MLDEFVISHYPGKRLIKNALSNVDDKIKQYENKFRNLKLAFQERAVLQIEITVFRVLDVVESLGDFRLRSGEPHLTMSDWVGS